jgi:serine/threonine-protein kinase
MDTELEARALKVLDEALDQPAERRGDWLDARCGAESALRDRVARLLRSADNISFHTGGAHLLAVDGEHPERIGAYRITGLIGQGGMGAVYHGERATGDFDHVAAIKLIRPGALSDELVERFRRERQTLARLAHPNIARLFDGGETEAGQPYLVMEYVDGRPLHAWIDEERPTWTARLELFAKVCAAVAHAHRNLIIHRDLTPANILVDKAGQPKLIDFGIARPANEAGGNAPHQTATPGFAPPERRAGAPATTLSDIFALGRLLERLAGEGGEPDLRAIIAKAAANDPELRYPTVEALPDDLERYRSGAAVEARGGGAGYRLRRFVRRHRLPVAVSISVLLMLIGALALTLIANGRAELARAEAEQRFEQTRAIAKTLLFETFDDVGKVPGGTEAQVSLARTALTYLDALAADRAAPDDVKAEVGRGYTRLSRAVGGGGGSQLGRLADADVLLRKARTILDPLYARRPADPIVAEAYAGMLIESAAQNIYNQNRPEIARKQARRARAALQPFATASPELAALYASSWQAEGDSFGWEENWPEARAAHQAAERFIQVLPVPLGTGTPVLRVRSANLRLLGEALHKAQEAQPAREALARAVAVNEQLVARAPQDPDLQRKLALSLWYSAVVHRTNKRNGEAEAAIERAVAVARRLADRDAGTAGSLQLLAATTEVQAQVLTDRGRHGAGVAAADQAVGTQRRLVSLAGSPPGARRSLAALLQTSGVSHYKSNALARACADWKESLGIYEALERGGELTKFDRQNGMVRMTIFTTKACDPLRGGLAIEN